MPPRSLLVAACTWSVLVGAVAAQDVRWRLPPGGAIQWQSTEAETCHAIDDPKRRAAPPHGTQPHAALLLANELDKDARATTVHLHDVRWLAPRLACDLGTFGKGRNVDLVVDDIVPFQPFRLRGTIADAAADGTQTMTFELVAAPAPAARERKRLAEKEPARQVHFDGSCTGSLRLQRKVDATAGIVAEFTAEVTLRIAYSPRYPVPNCDYVLRQTWTAAEVRTRRQAGFEAAVADAIRRGAENVRHELAIPDRGLLQPGPDQPSGEGYLALGLLTLLHAEVGADDAVVRQGFAELRRRNVRQTYSLALALMALERLHAPRNERDRLLAGTIDQPEPRKLVGDDADAMSRWTKALLANRDSETRSEYETRWSYEGPGFDNSNTQYGVLGLHSADLCEQKIGRTTWFAVAAHWLATQCPAEGPPVPLSLQPIQSTKAGVAPRPGATIASDNRTQAQRRASPRGWDYHTATDRPYGGMTAAGISSLTIALSHLENSPGKVDAELRKKIDQAILDGFAWLSKHRSIRHVPGPDIGHAMNWWYYWLYGLERACELSNVGLIDGHDWYHDHALLLLKAQEKDGGWGRLEETCWAILFLKKAQLPVFTRPR